MGAKKYGYDPDWVLPPGETLREFLDERRMTQDDLAARIGRSRKYVNQLLAGAAPLSPDVAVYLERVFSTPAEVWDSLESNYRLYLAKKADRDAMSERMGWARRFPYKDMAAAELVKDTRKPMERLVEVLRFFGVATPDDWEQTYANAVARFRTSTAAATTRESLTAWLRFGELQAALVETRPFSASKFERAVERSKSIMLKPVASWPESLKALFAPVGVAVLFTPQLGSTGMNGTTRWLTPKKALIQLTLRQKDGATVWFSLMHELAHVRQGRRKHIFIDLAKQSLTDPEELEADEFARNYLLDPVGHAAFVAKGDFSERSVRRHAASQGVIPGVVVGRLQHDGDLHYSELTNLKCRVGWARD